MLDILFKVYLDDQVTMNLDNNAEKNTAVGFLSIILSASSVTLYGF